jgi:hypothetical protein
LERTEVPSAVIDVRNIFRPSSPVTAPEQLVGRTAEIRRLMELLNTDDAIAVLNGPPAIGKSSILAVLEQVLAGYGPVLDQMGIPEVDRQVCGALVVRLEAVPEWKSVEDIVDPVMTQLADLVARPGRRWTGTSLVAKIGVFGTGAEAKFERPAVEPSPLAPIVEIGRAQVEQGRPPIVLILDEVELVADPSGFVLDICRAARRSVGLKIILGARDYSLTGLMRQDHAGARQMRSLEVPHLSDADLRAILANGLDLVEAVWKAVPMDQTAVNQVVDKAMGEPWYIQTIGAAIVNRAVNLPEDADLRVSQQVIRSIEFDAISSSLGFMRGVYERATAGAPRRADLLQALAKFPHSVIPDSYVRVVGQRIRKPLDHVNRLQAIQPDPVLVPADGGVRFASSQLRTYCRVCVSLGDMENTLIERDVDAWRSLS